MSILVAIALGWLATTALVALLCRMAARGDRAPAPSLPEDDRLALEELLIWEGLSQPTLRDTRPGAVAGAARKPEQVSLAGRP